MIALLKFVYCLEMFLRWAIWPMGPWAFNFIYLIWHMCNCFTVLSDAIEIHSVFFKLSLSWFCIKFVSLCLLCKLGYQSILSMLVYDSFLAHLSWKLKWAFLITYCPSSVCLSVCKLFTFSSSSQELLGQFQPNLAQSILGWRGFKFVQM